MILATTTTSDDTSSTTTTLNMRLPAAVGGLHRRLLAGLASAAARAKNPTIVSVAVDDRYVAPAGFHDFDRVVKVEVGPHGRVRAEEEKRWYPPDTGREITGVIRFVLHTANSGRVSLDGYHPTGIDVAVASTDRSETTRFTGSLNWTIEDKAILNEPGGDGFLEFVSLPDARAELVGDDRRVTAKQLEEWRAVVETYPAAHNQAPRAIWPTAGSFAHQDLQTILLRALLTEVARNGRFASASGS